MPSELLEIAFNFDRNLKRLWALELPTEEISITELEWHLDLPFFWKDTQPFSLNPRDVLNNPEQYRKWVDRIMEVDTNYPIDIIWWKGKWQIIDGLHRLCKLIIEGQSIIRVRKLSEENIGLIIPDNL
jgi:hypothetical protein